MNERKIVFPLPREEDDWPPAAFEGLWAQELPDGSYCIDNIPFFVMGISLNDQVAASLQPDGELRFDRVIKQNGHRTVRVIVFDEQDTNSTRDLLRALGCKSELSHLAGYLAVDVPPDVDARPIVAWLRDQASAGIIDFEEANVDW